MNRRLMTGVLMVIGLGLLGADRSNAQDSVKVGNRAPDFTLLAATKDSVIRAGVRLSDFRGRNNVIIAFYPSDWSGGCTKEMCTMRDNFVSLSELGAEVLGISGDYVYSHHQWAKSLDLQFALLSDHDHAVAKAYQSYNPQSGTNKRTVYLVDRSGTVVYIDRAYNPGSEDSFSALKAQLQRLNQ